MEPFFDFAENFRFIRISQNLAAVSCDESFNAYTIFRKVIGFRKEGMCIERFAPVNSPF
jgi:hypothetical protein